MARGLAEPLPHDDPRDIVPLLLQGLCDRGATVQPNNLIITKTASGYVNITYREHQARTLCLASALTRWGVRIGDRVATLLWNNAWHLQCYHAISCMGAVLHALNARLSPKDQSHIIGHAGDRVVILDADLFEPLSEVDSEVLDSVELFVCVGADGKPEHWSLPASLPAAKAMDYEAFVQTGYYKFSWPEFPETSPHSLCYTSGTTGLPKGVTYSHRSTYLNTVVAMVGTDLYAISGSMVVLPFVPMFHALSWGIPFATLMQGTRTVFTHRSSSSVALLDAILRWKVELSTGVPIVWQGVRDEIQKRGIEHLKDDMCLKMIITGGSAPPTDLMSWWYNNLTVDFLQGWGMTETNPSGTFAKRVAKYSDLKKSLTEQFGNVTKAGLPVPGVEMRIANRDNLDEDLPQGEVGELLVRGPFIITKYFQQDAPDKFHKGWLITGDIALFDEDGALILIDRSKDAIKSGGEWISSVDMENHISAMAEIGVAAVIAVPHPKWDERPVAVVTLSEDAGAGAVENLTQTVRQHCLKVFAKFQLPDDVIVWESLPLQSTGKMDKKGIRERILNSGYVVPSARGLVDKEKPGSAEANSSSPSAPNTAHSKL